jgi:ribosome-binding factor A
VIIKRKQNNNSRINKVSEIIRKAVSAILIKNDLPLNPPFNFPVSVTEVEMNSDLKIAYIYLTTHEDIENDELVEKLNSCKNYLSKEVSKLISLKFSPKLIFRYDESIDHVNKINRILSSEKVTKDTNQI